MEKIKVLVVFYSKSGTTQKVARYIKNKLDCDMEEIIDKKNRRGILGFIKSGYEALSRKTTKIEEVKYNPIDYDIILLGTPIWAGNITPALRTYIIENRDKIKLAAFFKVSAGPSNFKASEEMASLLGSKLAGEIEIIEKDVKSSSNKDKINEFLEDIMD